MIPSIIENVSGLPNLHLSSIRVTSSTTDRHAMSYSEKQ